MSLKWTEADRQIHCWMVEGRYKPVKVTASATTGIATSMGCDPKTEDTITLLVDWQNIQDPKQRGTAVYTASSVTVSPTRLPSPS